MYLQEIARFELGNDRFVVINKFRGEVQIHFRQYEKNDRGGYYPTKQGVYLTPARFATLLHFLNEIKNNAETMKEEFRYHLGGGTFVTGNTDYPLVHIRRYFLPEGQTTSHPTKKGLGLRRGEWITLLGHIENIKKLLDNDTLIPCFATHKDSTDEFLCDECHPFKPFPHAAK